MRRIVRTVALAMMVGTAGNAASEPGVESGTVPTHASPIIGEWRADDGSAIVAIAPEPGGATFVGTVIWLEDPLDEHGRALVDRRNPERDARSQPIVGLEVLSGLTPTRQGTWDGGTVYDPRTGSSYRCSAEVSEDGNVMTITVRKGPFTRTRTCTRVVTGAG